MPHFGSSLGTVFHQVRKLWIDLTCSICKKYQWSRSNDQYCNDKATFNLFVSNAPFPYPLKTLALGKNELIKKHWSTSARITWREKVRIPKLTFWFFWKLNLALKWFFQNCLSFQYFQRHVINHFLFFPTFFNI